MVIKCPAWTWVWSNIIPKTNITAGFKLINNFLQFLKPWKGSNGSHELMTIFIQIRPPELFYKKKLFHNVSQNFAIFTRKHLCWSLFLINSQAFRPVSMNIAKLLRTRISKNVSDNCKCLSNECLRGELLFLICYSD